MTWRLPQTFPAGASKGVTPFSSLLLRICQACSSPANTWLSIFILVQNLPPLALFLCLLRPCKSFTTLILLYICKDLWPPPVVNHSPWFNWSLSPCSTFITLPLAVNYLPCTCSALSIPQGMHSSPTVLLWFRLPDFLVSHVDLLALCSISIHFQYSRLLWKSSGYEHWICILHFTWKCKVSSSLCGCNSGKQFWECVPCRIVES